MVYLKKLICTYIIENFISIFSFRSYYGEIYLKHSKIYRDRFLTNIFNIKNISEIKNNFYIYIYI